MDILKFLTFLMVLILFIGHCYIVSEIYKNKEQIITILEFIKNIPDILNELFKTLEAIREEIMYSKNFDDTITQYI